LVETFEGGILRASSSDALRMIWPIFLGGWMAA
jgi:hypothetical protein